MSLTLSAHATCLGRSHCVQHPCTHRRLRPSRMQLWLPVNVIFVMMLATGIWALQLMGVAMVTIMKNLTNVITISGDYFLYGRTYNLYVWLSLLLISGSAIVGAKTDLDFTAWGYAAQIANCVFTAAYSLVLRGVMDKVRPTRVLGSFTRARASLEAARCCVVWLRAPVARAARSAVRQLCAALRCLTHRAGAAVAACRAARCACVRACRSLAYSAARWRRTTRCT